MQKGNIPMPSVDKKIIIKNQNRNEKNKKNDFSFFLFYILFFRVRNEAISNIMWKNEENIVSLSNWM